jgi:hypothetical protein
MHHVIARPGCDRAPHKMKINRRRFWSLSLLSLQLLLAACNFPQEGTPTPSGPDLILTYAAQTIQARLTLAAAGLQSTLMAGTPGFTPLFTTPSPAPASTLTPPPGGQTQPAGPCDRARFEADVNYPDNSPVAPGENFVKTWRLENTGNCTWDDRYSIVFERGDLLGGPAAAPLTTVAVPPGGMVDISLALKAPTDPGVYQGFWKLRNPAGQVFGLGENADKDFWVKIRVGGGQS